MSMGSIIAGGARLVKTQPALVAIWAAVYLVVMLAGMVLMRPWIGTMAALQQQAARNAALGIATPPAFPAAWFGQLFVLEFVMLVLLVIAFAAVVRAVAYPSGDRFAYLRLGMDELRLVGLGIVLTIAAFVVEVVAILAIGVISGVAAVAFGQGAATAMAVVLGIALLAAGVYVQVRLSLAGALTVLRGRIVIRDAWRATRGRFWTLFGAYLLLGLLFFVAMIVVVAVTNPHLLAAYASLDPQAIAAAGQEQMVRQAGGLTAGLIVQGVVGAVLGVVMGAVACGAVATAAIELGGSGPDARPEAPATGW